MRGILRNAFCALTVARGANALQTMINFINRNAQRVIRAIQLSETDHRDRVYVLRCGHCNNEYATNGAEVWERRCPFCQGGAVSPSVSDSGNKQGPDTAV